MPDNIGIKSSPDVNWRKELSPYVVTIKIIQTQTLSALSEDEGVYKSGHSGRADKFPVTFTGTLSKQAEDDASDTTGVDLIKTDSGTYSGITSSEVTLLIHQILMDGL